MKPAEPATPAESAVPATPREAHGMRMRTLGGTGIQVSRYCLGAMMFGAWGNRDHDDCIRIIHAALDAGINFIDTADVYSAGESEEIVGKALQGSARRGRARDQVPRPDGRGPEPSRATRAAGSCARSRTACAGSAPTTSTCTRSTGPTRTPTSTRRSARCPTSSHQGKIRVLGSSMFPADADRRGAVGGRAARPRAVPLRAAAVLDPRPRHRARRCCPSCQRYGMGVIAVEPARRRAG